jgi:IPT/TIG domain-containing protein
MWASARRCGKRARLIVPFAALALISVGAAPAQALSPTVLAFLPLTGPPGTSVTITGLAFNDVSPATAVAFNGTAASFSIDSGVQITATVPAGATSGTISVTDAEGTGTSIASFTVTPPAPVVAGFLPISGPVGTSVVIAGTDFTGATDVSFNGTSALFTEDSAIQITATVPAGATTGSVSVTTSGGTGTSLASFTVTEPPPVVLGVLPPMGEIDTPVVITGTGFTGATGVDFNGTDASFTVDSPIQISTVVPHGASSGLVTVTTPSGSGSSAAPFTVMSDPAPTVHPRTLSLKLTTGRVVRGRIKSADHFTDCTGHVIVKIQRKGKHGWKTIASVLTKATGTYKESVVHKGTFRALAKRVTKHGGADVCKRAVSPVRRRH